MNEEKRVSESGRMRIALVSMKDRLADVSFNLERHRYWIDRAMKESPDFIGFPEFSFSR